MACLLEEKLLIGFLWSQEKSGSYTLGHSFYSFHLHPSFRAVKKDSDGGA
jgi:hypothetical protein